MADLGGGGQQWATMDNNGQQLTIMDSNGQQWTTMDNNLWCYMHNMKYYPTDILMRCMYYDFLCNPIRMFVCLFSTVGFKCPRKLPFKFMHPQIACLKGCNSTLVAVI